MLTKSILTAAAIALAAGLGSASAGERFKVTTGSTFDALGTAPASVMSSLEMQGVVGAGGNTFAIVLVNWVRVMNNCECIDPLFTSPGTIGALDAIANNPSQPPVIIE